MSELSHKETFEQKIKERIRDDIGNLMPDEVLAEIVSKSVMDIINQPEQPETMYGQAKPPFIERVVRELLEQKINALIVDNEELSKNIDESIAKNMKDIKENFGASLFDSFLSGIGSSLHFQVENRLNNYLNNNHF